MCICDDAPGWFVCHHDVNTSRDKRYLLDADAAQDRDDEQNAAVSVPESVAGLTVPTR